MDLFSRIISLATELAKLARTLVADGMRFIALVGPEYSCRLRKIDMVKAVDGRQFNNVGGIRCSHGTTVRRISIQGLVCSPRMVVIQIRRHKSLEMPLVEHDDMVEKFPA